MGFVESLLTIALLFDLFLFVVLHFILSFKIAEKEDLAFMGVAIFGIFHIIKALVINEHREDPHYTIVLNAHRVCFVVLFIGSFALQFL